MSTDVKVAKQVIHDKLESQINTVAAKLDTLKAQAETAKANAEIKAIAELVPKKVAMQLKLQELKKSGEDRLHQAKADLETQIAFLREGCEGDRIEDKGPLMRRRRGDARSPRLPDSRFSHPPLARTMSKRRSKLGLRSPRFSSQ